jgi:ribosomal protein L37AE/L43A
MSEQVTYAEQEESRRERLSEVGTEPPCPFCQRPRVKRTDYTRCNRCGENWLMGEDLMGSPKAQRWGKFLANVRSTRSTVGTRTGNSGGAPTAESSTK